MKEVLITHWCDLCFTEDETRTEGTGHAYLDDGRTPVNVDLCDTHFKETLGRLNGLGQRPPAEGKSSPASLMRGPYTPRTGDRASITECPICGEHHKKVGVHVSTSHPGVVPDGWLQCTECSFVAHKPQSIARHFSTTHAELWEAQRATG